MTTDLYQRWIQYVFSRPDTKPEWYWDTDIKDFDASPEQVVVLVGKTFLRSGTDLAPFNDMQLANGLNYILNNTISDVPFLLCQKGVEEDLRIDAVQNMKFLYRDCFAKRCSPLLSHIDEPGAGPLNSFCYMMWDVSPLTRWKDVVLEVMEDALYLPHDACIESALHGLGHRYAQDKARVADIIRNFLARTTGLRPELRTYAAQARVGMVQ